MNRKVSPLILSACILLSGPPTVAAAGSAQPQAKSQEGPRKTRVAVTDFTFRDAAGFRDQELFSTQTLTERLKTALVSTHKFDLLEREQLDSVIKELQFATTSSVDANAAPRSGRLAGADYLVKGEISVFDVKQTTSPIPTTSFYQQRLVGNIICDLRVVNVETGKIATAAKVEAIQRFEKRVRDTSVEAADPMFYDDLQRQLVEKIANKVIETIYPIKIVSVDGDTVYLNRGEGGGIHAGDVLVAYRLGANIVDPDTNELLGQQETAVGEITIDEVQPMMTKATWRGEPGKAEKGMLVRLKLE